MSTENKINVGELRTGDPLELSFENIIDPVTGLPFTTMAGVQMEFTVKEKLDDLDVDAIANIKEDSSAVSVTGPASFDIRLISNAISATLIAGKVYFFDGKLKDSNGIWRSFDLAPAGSAREIYIGYFWVTPSITSTPDD